SKSDDPRIDIFRSRFEHIWREDIMNQYQSSLRPRPPGFRPVGWAPPKVARKEQSGVSAEGDKRSRKSKRSALDALDSNAVVGGGKEHSEEARKRRRLTTNR